MSEDRIVREQEEVRSRFGIIYSGRGYKNLERYVEANFECMTVTAMSRETGISRSTIQATCRKLGLYKFGMVDKDLKDDMVKELEYPWENYKITSDGKLINKNTNFVKKPFHKLGYLRYEIFRDGTYISISQHRLLALSFIPNPDNKPDVNHIDGCRDNNRLSNLEWVTHKENMAHAREVLGKVGMYGENSNFAKITEGQAEELIISMREGKSNREILHEFSYATKGILDGIRYQNNWKHLQ